ncbi:uncharacterized protein PADG_02274 [Paracoccidioides brasiliensis Pb18]|uniref:Uncharacterized protein n=1 Tax=Paracoccidioides brasiliensis (strain Pb18) TaxID=502780 RepID=C1G2A8_PARBD|nr:uncharacterized protein PADG_02274 [Paracoccidioides brasiliensis Pb18]EEH46124.1 hypothetical protein PADG_02274 [Paracoccidioides brasiliensis Pb18]
MARGSLSTSFLTRYIFKYSRSELSQDTFLCAFCHFMGLDIAAEHDPVLEKEENQLSERLAGVADFLLDTTFHAVSVGPIHCHVDLFMLLLAFIFYNQGLIPAIQRSSRVEPRIWNIFRHQTRYQFVKASASSVTTIAV